MFLNPTNNLIKQSKKSIAYSLTFGAQDRTLNDEEIAKIMEQIIEGLEKNGAALRA